MMTGLPEFAPPPAIAGETELRAEVRAFLDEALADRPLRERAQSWAGHDVDFSRRLGQRGWIGMTWPKRYGGHERSALERFVVIEELLAAGAPVSAHWTADRQFGPLLLAVGTEEQRREVLPRIAAGECRVAIGLSEPNAGSDLASVRTRAEPVDGGFVINGTKIWTSLANSAHYLMLLCRTDGGPDDRHRGLSQLMIDLSTPGIEINPISDMTGARHFNEVVFTDVFVPGTALVGVRGAGWTQAMGELAYERSGPERFLSSFVLYRALVERIRATGDEEGLRVIGRYASHFAHLRRLSLSIAGMLDRGENASLQAAFVKDLGATLEQEIVEAARPWLSAFPARDGDDEFAAILATTLVHAPSFSIRGGTREILRGMIAKGLGAR